MRSLIPTSAANSRSLMVAVVLGTALTAGGNKTASAAAAATRTTRMATEQELPPVVLDELTRYCQACWRNARVPFDQWEDCTQQVLTRLLERVPIGNWSIMLRSDDEDSPNRRELFRAIDATKKRSQRARKLQPLIPEIRDSRASQQYGLQEQREAVEQASERVLSPRQQRIVELSADGWAVQEIATELNSTAERVSDEKYKAIRKLRSYFGV
ncbi:MAG: sigma-70 family RNA polymerase sigma factor [Bacteroidales bacterium]|nr:sigma-70 family RNA polymerase sigma factor [Bacteroidales bacterium]